MQSGADIHEEALKRVQTLLTHPDDIQTKLPMLRNKFRSEKSVLEGQLLSSVRTLLEDIKKSQSLLITSSNSMEDIKRQLSQVDEQGRGTINLQNFSKICLTHKNFLSTRTVYDRFYELEGEIDRVAMLLHADLEFDYLDSRNLLLVHYHLVRLYEFYEKTMKQAQEGSLEIKMQLQRFFQKLENVWNMFDDFIWKLATNLLEFVVSGKRSLIVHIFKVVEFEERNRKIAEEKGLPVRGGRSFKSNLMVSLHEMVDSRFKGTKTPSDQVQESLDNTSFVIEELVLFHDELLPCVPPKYNLMDFLVLEYHRHVYEMINSLLCKQISPGDILLVISWVTTYYDQMNERLAVQKDLLEPSLLDDKEDLLITEYIKLTREKIGEWIMNLMNNESENFRSRSNAPECDAKGLYISPGITVDLFHIFRQHIESTMRSSRSKLLSDVVSECVSCVLEFQKNLEKVIQLETSDTLEKNDDESKRTLEYYLMMIANSSIISCDNLEEISRKVDREIEVEFKESCSLEFKKAIDGFMNLCKYCLALLIDTLFITIKPLLGKLFSPAWYNEPIVETMALFFEECFNEYKSCLHDYVFGKLITDSMERLLLGYLEAMRPKSVKFKVETCQTPLQEDYSHLIRVFSAYKPIKRVQKIFEPLDRVTQVVIGSKKMVFLDVYALWKPFPDIKLSFIEDVLARRDDMDKSSIRETMDSLKKKIKEENVGTSTPSVFSKMKD